MHLSTVLFPSLIEIDTPEAEVAFTTWASIEWCAGIVAAKVSVNRTEFLMEVVVELISVTEGANFSIWIKFGCKAVQ